MEKGPSQHEKDKYDTCHESVSPVRKCLRLPRLEEYDVPCWIKFVLAVVPWVCLFYTGIIMMTNGLGDKTNFMEALHFAYASIAFIGFGDIVPTYDWKFIVIHLPIIFIGQVTTYSRFYYIQTFYRTKILQVTGLFTDQKAKCNPQCSIMSHCDVSTKESFVNLFKK
uniref:Potassium channel domain-containing protein n=1 Tax=Acrobeloides nanus TaxID=290746 RepID=A0A914E489_9BILA